MTMTGLVSPVPRQREFTDLGVVAPGALLNVYLADTSTRATTWSNSDLADIHENTNPIVADAGGLFGPIYLDFGVQYDMVLTESDGTAIWSQENIGNGGVAQTRFDVTAYGAVGNGSTDDSVAVQAAINAAAVAGGEVYFPIGTYRLVSALSLTAGGVSFKGASRTLSVLRWTDAASKGLVIAGSAANVGAPMLSSNAAIGDKSVVVGSAAGLVVGGWAYFQDNGAHTGSFLTKIATIVGTTIGLQSAMPIALTTAASAQLFSYAALLAGIDISDLTFSCVAGSGTANKLTLLELRRCDNPHVTNCDFDGCAAPLITPATCMDGVISRCRLTNGQTVAASGIEIQTSTGMTVSDCHVENVAFGFTPARSPHVRIIGCKVVGRMGINDAAFGRGCRFSDCANFGQSIGNTFTDAIFFGLYFQDSAFCKSVGDTVAFNGISSSPGQEGIAVGGFLPAGSHHCSIIGATVRGSSGYGIFVSSSDGTTPENMYTQIDGCNVSACVQGAIVVQAANYTTICGGTYSGPTTTVGGILRITASAIKCLVADCNVVAESGTPDALNSSGGGGDTWVLNINTVLLIETHATDITTQTQASYTSTTPVATGANTTETVAFSVTPPAGILKAAKQFFEFNGYFLFAANGNTKTITVYVGTSTVAIVGTPNNIYGEVRVRGWWRSGTLVLWHCIAIEGTAIVRNVGASSSDNWANAQIFKMTMTNGSATADDIAFIAGDLRFK